MKKLEAWARTAILLTVASASVVGCKTTGSGSGQAPIVQPGAPGQNSQVVDAAQASDLSKVQATEANIKFMQSMFHHHAQAHDMVALVEKNTSRDDMRK